jgi:tetratricopeptide (TPR) repeat protein
MLRIERDRIVVAAAAVLSHAYALAAGFVWLDHAHLEDGLALARGGDFFGLFTQGFAGTGYYRPLMSLSLSVDALLGGSPLLYHATTLLWHAAAALMTAITGEKLGLSPRAANAAALLFAVHPVTGLVANAIAFRSEAMLAVLLLGLLAAHLSRAAWACGALLFAAALSKETGLIVGPLFVISLEIFRPAQRDKYARNWAVLGCEAAGLACALLLRQSSAPSWRASFPAMSTDEAIGSRLAAVTKSVLAVLFPVDVGVCDAFAITSSRAPTALLGLAVLLALGYLAYRRRGPAILLVLAVLPSLQLVPVMRWWSPHYLYLPLAFAAMLAAEGVERWGESALRRVAPVCLALGGLSLLDSRRYVSDAQLWSREIKLEPACREARYYLGDVAIQAQRWRDAAAHYERAVTPAPGIISYVDQGAALQNLGVAYFQQRRFEEARSAFQSALQIQSKEGSRRQLLQMLAAVEALSAKAALGAEND